MVEENVGKRFLELFDQLNLENNDDRRAGVFLMEEFYGQVLTAVGQDYVLEDFPYHRQNLATQWGKVEGWFETLDDYSIPSSLDGLIERLKHLRDDTAHNYLDGVNKENLKVIRNQAEDWREWVIETAEKLEEEQEDKSEREIIEERTRRILKRVKTKNTFEVPHLDNKMVDIKSKADRLEQKLDRISGNGNRIDKELVEVLMNAFELDRRVWGLMDEKEEYDKFKEGSYDSNFVL